MASTNSEIASSSSTRRCTYDVFLSFRGSDTRNSFADHLRSAMKQTGINVFIDNEKLVKGKDISLGLFSGIEKSEFAVVLISENYVRSEWCMMELTKIAELQRETRLKVLPVFYHVDRFDEQKNNFAEAFAKHPENPEIDEEQNEKWRAALREVSDLPGWDVHDRQESDVIKEICEEIVDRFSRNSPIRMESGLERPRSVSETESGPERRRSVSEMVSGPERPRSVYEMVSGPERPRSVSEEEMRRIQSYVEMLRRLGDDARRLLYFTFTAFFFLKKD